MSAGPLFQSIPFFNLEQKSDLHSFNAAAVSKIVIFF